MAFLNHTKVRTSSYHLPKTKQFAPKDRPKRKGSSSQLPCLRDFRAVSFRKYMSIPVKADCEICDVPFSLLRRRHHCCLADAFVQTSC